MKKLLLFILTFAYIASSSGAIIYIHQCMGKTIAWDIIEDEGNSCAKCGMHKNAPNDCCKDHVKVLKVHNDQNLPNAFFSKITLHHALPVRHVSFSSFVVTNSENKTGENYTPPYRSNRIKHYILYCTFLI